MKHLALVGIALFYSLVGHASETRRFGFFIGSDDAKGKVKLKYAVSDAVAVSKVMGELGGVANRDSHLLLNPERGEVLSRLKKIRTQIEQGKKPGARTEFVFYFSGHSDGEGLLFGAERLPYKVLRQSITEILTDVSVIILDSCASGSFTRLKGGHRAPPFLTDGMSKLKGYVALTSSSSTEAAQESDKIQSSYFTHFLVSGLRGAADRTSNRRVTLNEAYQYAYAETLASTERSMGGAQHPSYNIALNGSGELIMTDLRRNSAELLFDKNLQGRIVILDQNERAVAELNKDGKYPATMGLEPGAYSLLLTHNGKLNRATVLLSKDQSKSIGVADFGVLQAEATVSRGRSEGADSLQAARPEERRSARETQKTLGIVIPSAMIAAGLLLIGHGEASNAMVEVYLGIGIAAVAVPTFFAIYPFGPDPRAARLVPENEKVHGLQFAWRF